LLVAHRGASELAPENTLAAFRLAVAGGADIIELDIQLSSDDHAIVFHDKFLFRTTRAWGFVSRKTLAQLKALDAGSWHSAEFAGEPIPTLSEVLAWARTQPPPLSLMLDLKGGSDFLKRGLAEKSIQLVAEHGLTNAVVFTASYAPFVERIKKVAPDIAIGVSVHLSWFDRLLFWLSRRLPGLQGNSLVRRQRQRPLEINRALGAHALPTLAMALTPSLVEAVHAAGLAVCAGSIGDYPATIALGVDTVSADNPAAVREKYLS
jgi:glycerophosphoryl diester phosphodiesterase